MPGFEIALVRLSGLSNKSRGQVELLIIVIHRTSSDRVDGFLRRLSIHAQRPISGDGFDGRQDAGHNEQTISRQTHAEIEDCPRHG